MVRFKVLIGVFAIILLALGSTAVAQGRIDTSSGSTLQGAVTTSQTAVFAAFLSSIDGAVDTAISVSNILPAPAGIDTSVDNAGSDDSGPCTFFLWNRDGTGSAWSTADDPSIGTGLDDMGNLNAGWTYTVLLSEIVGEDEFVGYGWVVCDTDATAGTTTVIVPGFLNQFSVMAPAIGGIGVNGNQ